MNNVVSIDLEVIMPHVNAIQRKTEENIELCKMAKLKIESISTQGNVPTAVVDKVAEKMEQMGPRFNVLVESAVDLTRTLQTKASELEDTEDETLRGIDNI